MSDKYLPNIGELAGEHAERDAIHIAVAPVVAGEDLRPGEEIGFVPGSTSVVKRKDSINGMSVGVVDPYLKAAVGEGQRFWMFLFPNTITFLRHHWQHPAFEFDNATSIAEAWLRGFARKWNFDYDRMVEEATEGNYVIATGVDLHSRYELGGDEPLFWHYLEVLTDKRFDEQHRENMGWSCSC